MNGLTLVGIAIVVLAFAYILYGRWLVKTWGIDPKAKTPAVRLEDGRSNNCGYVRLASCIFMALNRWSLLRSCPRFYGSLCFS